MLPRIKHILNIEPYKIICEWTSGEIRIIDLEPKLLETIKKKSDNSYKKLYNPDIFYTLQLDADAGTICWPNLIKMKDYDGKIKPAQFDICPDLLYSISVPYNKY